MQTVKFNSRPVFTKSLGDVMLQLVSYEPLLRIEYPGNRGDMMADVFVSVRKQDEHGLFSEPFVLQLQGRLWDRLAKQAAMAAGANRQKPDAVDGWVFSVHDEGKDIFVMWVG